MLVIDHEERISIEDVISNELFNDVRDMQEFPEMNEVDKKLKLITEDFIKRCNVYKLDGKEKFDKYFEDEVVENFKTKDENGNDQIIEPVKLKLEHLKIVANFFLFDIEPEETLQSGKNGTVP